MSYDSDNPFINPQNWLNIGLLTPRSQSNLPRSTDILSEPLMTFGSKLTGQAATNPPLLDTLFSQAMTGEKAATTKPPAKGSGPRLQQVGRRTKKPLPYGVIYNEQGDLDYDSGIWNGSSNEVKGQIENAARGLPRRVEDYERGEFPVAEQSPAANKSLTPRRPASASTQSMALLSPKRRPQW